MAGCRSTVKNKSKDIWNKYLSFFKFLNNLICVSFVSQHLYILGLNYQCMQWFNGSSPITTSTKNCPVVREATKKKQEKKFTTVVNYGGGQQILLCEPQKSAFFRANFPKNMLKLIHNVPFVCLTKYNHLIHSKFQMQGFIYAYFHSK